MPRDFFRLASFYLKSSYLLNSYNLTSIAIPYLSVIMQNRNKMIRKITMDQYINKPTPAFIAASWVALLAGASAYGIGLFNANMLLNEKGYYLILILYGLFSAVSLQKIIRDKLEGMHVTPIYFALCWASVIICIALLAVGLWNASLQLSEKGFYIMAFLLSLFGAVAVQKNIRDLEYIRLKSAPELTTKILEENHKALELPQKTYKDD